MYKFQVTTEKKKLCTMKKISLLTSKKMESIKKACTFFKLLFENNLRSLEFFSVE